MTTTLADYRISLTYDQAVDTARLLAEKWPKHTARHAYLDSKEEPHCFVAHVLAENGFKPIASWWDSPRMRTYGSEWPQTLSTDVLNTTRHRDTHVSFMFNEIFLNQDLMRNAFLTRLQIAQDHYKDTTWSNAFKRALAYTTRIEQQKAAAHA